MADAGFDYGDLPLEVRHDLKRIEKGILAIDKKKTRGGVAIGERLLVAKGHLGHGAFGRWCDRVLGYTRRTAQRYMNAASLFQRYGEVVLEMPLTAAQDVGAESVDPDVVHEVLERVRVGRVTVEWVKERIRRSKSDRSGKASHADHSQVMAAMITRVLDLEHCRLLVAFVAERPAARLFMRDLADHAAAKIGRSRSGSVRHVPLHLTAN